VNQFFLFQQGDEIVKNIKLNKIRNKIFYLFLITGWNRHLSLMVPLSHGGKKKSVPRSNVTSKTLYTHHHLLFFVGICRIPNNIYAFPLIIHCLSYMIFRHWNSCFHRLLQIKTLIFRWGMNHLNLFFSCFLIFHDLHH